MTFGGLIFFIVIGGVAGWLAGLIVRGGGFGLIGDIVVGVIGALIGGWLFGLFGIAVGGVVGFPVGSARRRDHPDFHYPAGQASVIAEVTLRLGQVCQRR